MVGGRSAPAKHVRVNGFIKPSWWDRGGKRAVGEGGGE